MPEHQAAPCVGMVGGGQLARMTYQAGIALGLTVRVLAARPDDSAALAGADVQVGSPDAPEALLRFASGCDIVTFDHELVAAEGLAALVDAGHVLRPTPETLRFAQDKRYQRQRLGDLGFPVPAWQPAASAEDLDGFAAEHGWPVVVKAVRGGYDGRGVWMVEDAVAARRLCAEAEQAGVALLVEAHVPIDLELAVLVARRPGGDTVVYPVVETVQAGGICHEVLAPAPVSEAVAARAAAMGVRLAEATGAVGILAVELFLSGGEVLVNELATRPHNSGHFSIDGCVTSQFENHLRAVADWPLGDPGLVAPAVAMANVLGAADAVVPTAALHAALTDPGVKVHIYGKTPRAGRKLGHVTVAAADLDEARDRVRRAAAVLAGSYQEVHR